VSASGSTDCDVYAFVHLGSTSGKIGMYSCKPLQHFGVLFRLVVMNSLSMLAELFGRKESDKKAS
jgi:hypothetical protein